MQEIDVEASKVVAQIRGLSASLASIF
jgi:hypothetical protein